MVQVEVQAVHNFNSEESIKNGDKMVYYRINCICGNSTRAYGHYLKFYSLNGIYKNNCICGKINNINTEALYG